MKKVMAVSLVLMLGLSACGTMSNSQATGAGVGALAGGVIGYQFGAGWGQILATTTGAVLGGMGGYYVGDSVSK